MSDVAVFLYRSIQTSPSLNILRPQVTLNLSHHANTLTVDALPDSGATVNVLPFSIGLELGLVWEEQPKIGALVGNLANYATRGVVLRAAIGSFPSLDLAFVWIPTDNVPVLLGQVNFFAEFDVCFSYSRRVVEVRLKA